MAPTVWVTPGLSSPRLPPSSPLLSTLLPPRSPPSSAPLLSALLAPAATLTAALGFTEPMAREIKVPSDVKAIDLEADQDEDNEAHGILYERKIAVGQVTVRLPLRWHVPTLIALLYGFLPWVIPLVFFIHFCFTEHFVSFYANIITAFATVLNEGFLKPLMKEPRPSKTANRAKDGTPTYGMPSGHVINAAALMVWAVLEVCVKGPGLEGRFQSLTVGWLITIVVLMGPVPWARVYNYDHTVRQCVVSLMLGLFVGTTAFAIRVYYFSGHWKPWYDQGVPRITPVTPQSFLAD